MRFPPDHLLVAVELRSLGVIGHGLFLTEAVTAGQVIAVFGGRSMSGDSFRSLPHHRQQRAIQVGEDVYLVSDDDPTLGDYINHSCEPTCSLIGEITLAAIRDLEVGDQVTYDYATSDSTPYDEFECECLSPGCRGKVTGEDWMNPDVQAANRGRFSPYLQRRIDQLGE